MNTFSGKEFTDDQWQVALQEFQKPHKEKVVQYVVYSRPRDANDFYVVRRWEIANGVAKDCEGYGFKTLGDARAIIPSWALCIGRNPMDDAAILEVWI